MEELYMLWRAFVAYDVVKVQRQRHFTLKVILMWTIHD
jgi:hypothetical protein